MIQFRNPSTGLIETFKGLKGKDGKSAYEYATSMGYPGSEEDFAKLMSYDAKEAIEKLLQDMAGVANIEEVTQAEYDALGNEKLSNDVMYCIKDADPSNEGEEEEEEPVYVDQLVAGNGSRLVMQGDDNVVAYKADGTHLWDSMSTNTGLFFSLSPRGTFSGDANDYANLKNGIYRVSGGSNMPTDNGFLINMFAFPDNPSSVCIQIALNFSAETKQIRTCWYGTWYPWYDL